MIDESEGGRVGPRWGPGQIIEKIKTNGILSPLLWLIVVVFFVTSPFMYLLPELRTQIFNLWVCLTAFACVAFTYFGLVDPKKLQSEDYQIETQKLDLLQDEQNRTVLLDAKQTTNTHFEVVGQ